jgi:hypothetical protein
MWYSINVTAMTVITSLYIYYSRIIIIYGIVVLLKVWGYIQ